MGGIYLGSSYRILILPYYLGFHKGRHGPRSRMGQVLDARLSVKGGELSCGNRLRRDGDVPRRHLALWWLYVRHCILSLRAIIAHGSGGLPTLRRISLLISPARHLPWR